MERERERGKRAMRRRNEPDETDAVERKRNGGTNDGNKLGSEELDTR